MQPHGGATCQLREARGVWESLRGLESRPPETVDFERAALRAPVLAPEAEPLQCAHGVPCVRAARVRPPGAGVPRRGFSCNEGVLRSSSEERKEKNEKSQALPLPPGREGAPRLRFSFERAVNLEPRGDSGKAPRGEHGTVCFSTKI